jgi:hypothetical protein
MLENTEMKSSHEPHAYEDVVKWNLHPLYNFSFSVGKCSTGPPTLWWLTDAGPPCPLNNSVLVRGATNPTCGFWILWLPLREKDTVETCPYKEQRHIGRTSPSSCLADASQGVSLIRIDLRRVLGRAHLTLQSNLRRALRVCVTNWITGWGHCGTNRRHTLSDACLLFDAPHGHPGCQLYPRASQDLATVLYQHKKHTKTQHTKTYDQTINLHTWWMEITHSIIFINQILDKVYCIEHKVYQLTIRQSLTAI